MKKKINTRAKMQRTNKKILDKLRARGIKFLKLFEHTRFSKDYHLGGAEFDAFGWNAFENCNKRKICFYQFKTNKSCPKKEIAEYKKIEKKYFCKCYWITYFDNQLKRGPRRGQVILYSVENPKGIVL